MSYVCGGRDDGSKRLYCCRSQANVDFIYCRLLFSAAPDFILNFLPFSVLSLIFNTAPHPEQKLWLN